MIIYLVLLAIAIVVGLIRQKYQPVVSVGVVPAATCNTISQLGHFGWGILFIIIPGLFLGTRYVWYNASFWNVATAIKEFGYDYADEDDVLRGSSLEDYSRYQAGIATGIALLYAKEYFMGSCP